MIETRISRNAKSVFDYRVVAANADEAETPAQDLRP